MAEKPHGRRVGRPATMRNGRDVTIYLDDESVAVAAKIGNGSISAGIRLALKQANERSKNS